MADKIGVLGEASTATIGTVTVYTCPTAKAARGRWMFRFKGSAAGGTIIDFYVNGLKIATVPAMTADYYVFSIKSAGLRAAEQSAEPIGTTAALTVSPADPIYYLNAGDTIQYAISGAAAAAANVQFVGTEVDAE